MDKRIIIRNKVKIKVRNKIKILYYLIMRIRRKLPLIKIRIYFMDEIFLLMK